MKNVVLFLYLVVGAAGTITLVAIETGMADFLFPFMYLVVLVVLVFNAFAWIPAVILIVVCRDSWLIVVPAVLVIVSSLAFFLADDFTAAPLIWTAAFFPVAFACGLIWLFNRMKGTDT